MKTSNRSEAESFMIRKTEHLVSIEGKTSYKPDGKSLLYKNYLSIIYLLQYFKKIEPLKIRHNLTDVS